MRFSMQQFARAFMALVFVFNSFACGGGGNGPTGPNGGPPPVTFTLEYDNAAPVQCRVIGSASPQARFAVRAVGATPNGTVEFHYSRPYDPECEKVWGVGFESCQAANMVMTNPAIGRTSPTGPYVAGWSFTGALNFGVHSVYAIDLGTGRKTDTLTLTVTICS